MLTDPVSQCANEPARLAALQRYDILDTPPEAIFDDVTQLASSICDTPIALITLIDEHRQWFKSRRGLEQAETAREIAFCSVAIEGEDVMQVNDTKQDSRFRNNPLVTGNPHIGFYAGAPLVTPDGLRIGTVCVIDHKPRNLSATQLNALRALSSQVVANLELRRALLLAAAAREALAKEIEHGAVIEESRRQSDSFMRSTLDSLRDNIAILDERGVIVHVNDAWSDFAAGNCTPEVISNTAKGVNYLAVCDKAAAGGCDEAVEVAQALRDILGGKQQSPFSLEYPCHAPQTKRWFVVQVSAFGTEQNRHAVVSHRNITERRIADERLRDLNTTLEQRVFQRTNDLEKAYASLHDSEERLRGLFDNASVGIVACDMQGNLLRINDAYLQLTGLKRQQLLGRNLLDYLHAEDRMDFFNQLQQLATGQLPGFDVDARSGGEASKAGQWQRFSITAIHDKDAAIKQFVALVQDLRVVKESQLQRSMIFNRSRDMMVIADLQGRFHVTNKACTHILGYSAEELTSFDFMDLAHPDDLETARAELGALARGESAQPLEVRMRGSKGEYRDIVWKSVPWTEQGLFLGVGHDQTSIRAAERMLRAQAKMLQRAEQMAQIGSWQFEFGQSVVLCSAGLRTIIDLQSDAEHVELEHLLKCVLASDRSRLEQSIESVATTHVPQRIQCQVRRTDGEVRTVQTSIDVMRDSKNKISGVIGACLDITDMSQTVEMLRHSESQLRAFGRKLEKIREEERANISREIHDELGQVLTALKIDMTLLSRDIVDPVGDTPAAGDIVQALESMQKLVDTTIKSVRTIATQLRPEVLDAFGLVAAIRWHASEFERRTEIACSVDADEDLLALTPDTRIALFRITQEAMTNVARHAAASQISIKVARHDHNIVLVIKDNGRGVDIKQLVATTSLGVMGMRERATMIGGQFQIRRDQGSGTVIEVQAPLDSHLAAGEPR